MWQCECEQSIHIQQPRGLGLGPSPFVAGPSCHYSTVRHLWNICEYILDIFVKTCLQSMLPWLFSHILGHCSQFFKLSLVLYTVLLCSRKLGLGLETSSLGLGLERKAWSWSVWHRISGRRGRPEQSLLHVKLGQWVPYNSVADSFHTKKLCSRLSSTKF